MRTRYKITKIGLSELLLSRLILSYDGDMNIDESHTKTVLGIFKVTYFVLITDAGYKLPEDQDLYHHVINNDTLLQKIFSYVSLRQYTDEDDWSTFGNYAT